MAGITLAVAIQSFERELGCLGDRELVIATIAEALEFALHQGGGGNILREWRLPVRNGLVSLPRDLETPIKFKFAHSANGGFGVFHSPYLSYSSAGVRTTSGYTDWNPQYELQAGYTPTQFAVPPCGARLVLTTTNYEDVGAKFSIQGKQNGRDIAPLHNGYKTSGEILTVYHANDTEKKYSAYSFNEITNVVKDLTCSYITLTAIDDHGSMYFLSLYHPDEEVPQYKQIRMFAGPTWSGSENCDTYIHILGRINPSIVYIRDEDVLPISSLQVLKLLAKRAKYDSENDFENAILMERRVSSILRKQFIYQQPPGRGMSINLRSGGGSLKNI